MPTLLDLLACPACQGALDREWTCTGCGARYSAAGRHSRPAPGRRRAHRHGAPILRTGAVPRLPAARQPGGACGRARSAASSRACWIAAIAPDARILEIGCGTGQMSLYLARGGADRDRRRPHARIAAAGRRPRPDASASSGVQFVETDLHRPGLRAGAFDVVYASGVLHHTPDPRPSFARIAAASAPRRHDRARPLQCLRAHPAAAAAGRRAALGISLDPVRSGAARPQERAGPARGLAARPISPSRGASPHRGAKCAAGSRKTASNISGPIPAC